MTNTLIFDLGGVILNRWLWDFREYLVTNYGITNEDTINIFIKKYYKPYFSGEINEENFWKWALNDLGIKAEWKYLKQKLLDFYEPNSGMLALLNFLRDKGYKTILLSDQTKDWWPTLNQKWEIESHFDYCIISAEVGVNKPNKRIYEIALEKWRSSAEDSIFIDDLEENLIPAKDLWIKTILYKNTKQLKEELMSLGIL